MENKLKKLRTSRGVSGTHLSKIMGFKHSSGYSELEKRFPEGNRLSFERAKILSDSMNLSLPELYDLLY